MKTGHILIALALLLIAFKGIKIEIVHKGIPTEIKMEQALYAKYSALELHNRHEFAPYSQISLNHTNH